MADETQILPAGSPMVGKSPWLNELTSRWSQGVTPCVWEVLGTVDLSTSELVEILPFDQAQHWKHHNPILVERYFEHWPALLDDASSALTLIRAEFELRSRLGQAPTWAEYMHRFPRWQHAIRTQLGCETAQATIMPTYTTPPGEETLLPATTPRGEETILNAAPSSPTQRDTLLGAHASPAPSAEEIEFPQIPGYELVQELGRGGMGVVYKAHQVRAGRDVALKVIRPDMLSLMPQDTQSNTVGRFRHEAQAAGRLLHDNIVTVYEVGEWNTYHYYAMRMVEGPSLIQLVRERPLENQLAAQFLAGTARGVQFAHDQGILHRDLKPHNVLIDSRTQRPLVADFGLAKFTADTNELTRAGDVIGTPSYMSPEQAKDSSKVTALSDVYSLGATLYHVLAGRPPFQAANLGETLRQILHEEPLPPRQLNPAIDSDLETICLKCLQKEPAKRYASSGEFADDLERYLRNEPILARPVSASEKVFRWCKRNPALASSISAVILLAIIAVTSIVVGYRETVIALADAEESLKQALEAVDELHTQVSEESLLGQPGLQPLRRSLLLSAQQHYQKFLDKKWENPAIRFEVANAVYRVGDIERTFGNFEKADELFTIAEEKLRAMAQQQPENPKVSLALSNTLNAQAQVLSIQGNLDDSLLKFREGLKIRDSLANIFIHDKEFIRKQANMHMNCGIVHLQKMEADPAIQEQLKGQQLRLELFKRFPDDERLTFDLAKGAFNLARFYFAKSSSSNSPEEYKEDMNSGTVELKNAIQFFEELLQKQPKHVIYRSHLVTCLRILATNTNEPRDYERALREITLLASENPAVEEYQLDRVETMLLYAGDLVGRQRIEEALTFHAEIERILQPLTATSVDACKLAADNQKFWAMSLTLSNSESKSHLLQALDYWKQYVQLGGSPEFTKDYIPEIEKLIKTIDQPSQPDARISPD